MKHVLRHSGEYLLMTMGFKVYLHRSFLSFHTERKYFRLFFPINAKCDFNSLTSNRTCGNRHKESMQTWSYLNGASATALVNMANRSANSSSVSHMRIRQSGCFICKSTRASSTSTLDTITLGTDSLFIFFCRLLLELSLSEELFPRTAFRNWCFWASLTSL